MREEVEETVKEERLSRLLSEIGRQARRFNSSMIGSKTPVLFTRKGKGEGQALGYSPYMQPVHVDDALDLIGEIRMVSLVAATATSLSGSLLEGRRPTLESVSGAGA